MEEEAEVEAVEIDHDGLLFTSGSVVIAGKLQVAVLIEAFLLSACWDVVEDVDLRGDLAVVGHQFYLADVSHSVELQCDLLRVCAEPPRLPPL